MKTNTKIRWYNELRPLDSLTPWEKNPRIMKAKGMKDLKKSIDRFGLAEPIVINQDGTIIGGHARYYTLQEGSVDEVQCYVPDRNLSEKELEELNIRLNKNIAGDFDFEMLEDNFDVEELIDWGYDESELVFDFSLMDQEEEDHGEHELSENEMEQLGLSAITFVFLDHKADELKSLLKDMSVEEKGEHIYGCVKKEYLRNLGC
jgi:ParB-like chromosome segregation protein Spo0J|tara:strand:+ start:1025 stop:1636 length:612 start_codon:yes stop_codon:yes gene_type:complete